MLLAELAPQRELEAGLLLLEGRAPAGRAPELRTSEPARLTGRLLEDDCADWRLCVRASGLLKWECALTGFPATGLRTAAGRGAGTASGMEDSFGAATSADACKSTDACKISGIADGFQC